MDLVNLRVADATGASGRAAPRQLGALRGPPAGGQARPDRRLQRDRATACGAALELIELGEVQNAYSILDRSNEPLVDFCREREIAFVPFFPLGSAFSGGPAKLAADPAVAAVAARHGVTPSQVALAWLLARYDRILLIPGTTSVAHLEENLAAGEVALDEDDLAWLESVEQWAARSAGGALLAAAPPRSVQIV